MNLMSASAKGDLAAVKKYLAEGVDINAADGTGRTALIEAAWAGHAEVVKLLIDKKVTIEALDNSGYSALMRAAEEGHCPVATLLLAKGADVNMRGKVRGTTALMLAAERGHLKMLELLLKHGAKINAINQYEETALARAYLTNQTKAAKFLESKGGRGKPERSAYSHYTPGDREKTKVVLPQWSAAAADAGIDDDDTDSAPGGTVSSEDLFDD